ncbi:MAG: hypothetical protein ACI82I_002224 [Gammaproteobacteria bacterium]|jgi:hypothetical protein
MFVFRFGLFRFYFAVLFAVGFAVQGLSAQERSSSAQLIQTIRENPDNRAARWALSQVAFQAGNYDAARYHVQLLLRTSRSQNDVDTLTRALAEITAADPWNVALSFAFLPSTNIRRTTYNTKFETALGIFTPTGGGDEESGVGLSVGAGLSYALSLPDNSRLTLRARTDHYLYKSSDLNQTRLLFAVRRDSFAVGRNTALEPYVRLRYDEDQTLERRDVGLNLSTGWWLEGGAQLTVSAVLEDRDYLLSDALDGPYGRLSIRYSYAFDERTRLGFGVALARSGPESGHLRYSEGQLSINATRRFQDVGMVGLFGQYTMRHYDELFPATTLIRADERLALGLSFQPSSFEMFGSRPKISCQVERNSSNIALYDYNTTDCRLTFDRTF